MRRVARSLDSGASFCELGVEPALVEPDWGCSADLVRVPPEQGSGEEWLLFSNPSYRDSKSVEARRASRRRLTIHASRDGGRTWRVRRVLHEGPAAYSSLAMTSEGFVLCLFERGDRHPYEGLDLARFDISWLTLRD
jgi:sialidase-1